MRPYVFSSVRSTNTTPLICSVAVTPTSFLSRSSGNSRKIFERIASASASLSWSSSSVVRKIQFHDFSYSTPKFEGFLVKRRFSVRSTTQVSDSGSIDSPMMQSMQKKIKEQLNADEVIVRDAYGDGRHVSIDVISSAFEGQSAVNRQRMVYKAIWEELQSTVHAVDQMTTKTPAEAVESW
ncbi:protein BOLA4, chloroplastic/mitochondrial-like [Magnolia sinica]|uniref:protein BOLA4, chloroplastic/mitochondrial-like n=1 Tax=Magnolia sinica TaxID=86752 RepID=UPI0026598359|nr:protein BOLA4, chloroplastic/mitochondrial-like [Magnolia sinica]